MSTLTANTPVRNVPATPLMLHEVPLSRRRALSAKPLRKQVEQEVEAAPSASAASELAREAMADRRTTQERVLDCVVDGLMAELGWGSLPNTSHSQQIGAR